MQIGAVSLGFSGTTLPQVFEAIAEMGGTCVEVNSCTEEHHGIALTPETVPQIKQWADDYGLTIGSFSGYGDFTKTDANSLDAEVERLLATCRIAATMGVPVVRAVVGDSDAHFADLRSQVVSAFQQCAVQVERLGVKLGIENHGHLVNDGSLLASLVEEVDHPNVGLTLDTGNFAWAGHDAAQVQEDFEAVLPHVVNLHIKDGIWKDGHFPFVPAGDGELAICDVIRRLHQVGYQEMVYSEYEGTGDFHDGTRRSIAFLRQCVEGLQ